MVNIRRNNRFNRGEENKNQSTTTNGGGGGVVGGGGGGPTRSWGAAVSSQSMSTSSSLGSPSSRSEAAAAAGDTAFLLLNNLDIQGDDDAGSQVTAGDGRKKRVQRAAGGDRSGRGLRQFSMKVCEKVESKGITTYNEVADELVAEFSCPANGLTAPDQQPHDEKNIRRRVYDALNVLMAMDIISKEKKEIQWKGLPQTSLDDIEQLKRESVGLQNCIEKKSAYLEELEEQFIGLQNLIERNKQINDSEKGSSGGVALPFILVQTRPHATVEVEISEDMQLVHLDFNSTPFELHDDNFVLKGMNFCETPQRQNISVNGGENSNMGSSISYQSQTYHNPPRPSICAKPPKSTPIPGILKARVKHEPQ